MSSEQSSYLFVPEKRPQATLRLVIAHHAGGSASAYLPLHKLLPSWIETVLVELPGRGARFRAPFVTEFKDVLSNLLRDLEKLGKKPTALFGHSMGALLMSELARELTAKGEVPLHLFVSAVKSPQNYTKRSKEPRTDAYFLDRLKRYEGTPQALLDNSEMLQIILAIYRADYRLLDSFSYDPSRPLTCPMSVLGGLADADVTAEELESWRKETSGPSSIHTFEGGHFYIQQQLPAIARLLQDKLH